MATPKPIDHVWRPRLRPRLQKLLVLVILAAVIVLAASVVLGVKWRRPEVITVVAVLCCGRLILYDGVGGLLLAQMLVCTSFFEVGVGASVVIVSLLIWEVAAELVTIATLFDVGRANQIDLALFQYQWILLFINKYHACPISFGRSLIHRHQSTLRKASMMRNPSLIFVPICLNLVLVHTARLLGGGGRGATAGVLQVVPVKVLLEGGGWQLEVAVDGVAHQVGLGDDIVMLPMRLAVLVVRLAYLLLLCEVGRVWLRGYCIGGQWRYTRASRQR